MSVVGHPIVVRRAEPRDAEVIHAIFAGPKVIAETLQLPDPSLEACRKRLADVAATEYLLMATVDGEVIGNLGLHEVSKSPRRRHVGGIGMSVRDDHQGRGVGMALMRAALELADGWINYQRLELWVFTDNLPALAFYRSFGFVIEGTCRAHAFRDGRYADTYAMARLHPALAAGAQQ